MYFFIKTEEFKHTNIALQARALRDPEGTAQDRTVLVYWYKLLYYSKGKQLRDGGASTQETAFRRRCFLRVPAPVFGNRARNASTLKA